MTKTLFVSKIKEFKGTMMKYFTFLLICMVTLCSCHKDGLPTSAWVAYIAYIDSSGNDLFTDGSNGYVVDSVRMYYYLDGVRTLATTARPGVIPTYPWGISPFTHDFGSGIYSGLAMLTNFGIANDSTTIFIDLKPGVEDTLACKFTNDDQVLYLAWYNRVPKMTAAGKGDPFFIVVK